MERTSLLMDWNGWNIHERLSICSSPRSIIFHHLKAGHFTILSSSSLFLSLRFCVFQNYLSLFSFSYVLFSYHFLSSNNYMLLRFLFLMVHVLILIFYYYLLPLSFGISFPFPFVLSLFIFSSFQSSPFAFWILYLLSLRKVHRRLNPSWKICSLALDSFSFIFLIIS